MLDHNIQAALAKLDKSVPKRRRYVVPMVSAIAVFVLTAGASVFGYEKMVPSITQDNLMRMIVVSARSTEMDPVRLIYSIEDKIGKSVDEFDRLDRAQAVEFLLDKIELQKNKAEWVVY